MRLVICSALCVFLAFQVYLFSSFSVLSGILTGNFKGEPSMSLPVSNHYAHYSQPATESISWTQKGGWVVKGKGSIKEQDIDRLLLEMVEKSKSEERKPVLQIRIPANASPGVFVGLTKRMERAGISQFRLAVTKH